MPRNRNNRLVGTSTLRLVTTMPLPSCIAYGIYFTQWPKTFSTRELLARLRAVIRRSIITSIESEQQPPSSVTIGGLRIDQESRVASLDGGTLQLTAVEFDLLLSLAKAAGRVKTREQLLLEVADRNFEVFDRSIDVHISSIPKNSETIGNRRTSSLRFAVSDT
ncbi:MAG: response regulator transcription factor [Bryobacteraceae bacterium]